MAHEHSKNQSSSTKRPMNWQLASLGGLVSLIASILFGHAWVISDYLIHPGCCSDLLPSRSDLPQYVRMIPGDMEAELSLPVEQLAFDSLDDPSNHARGKSLAGWLIPAEGSDRYLPPICCAHPQIADWQRRCGTRARLGLRQPPDAVSGEGLE